MRFDKVVVLAIADLQMNHLVKHLCGRKEFRVHRALCPFVGLGEVAVFSSLFVGLTANQYMARPSPFSAWHSMPFGSAGHSFANAAVPESMMASVNPKASFFIPQNPFQAIRYDSLAGSPCAVPDMIRARGYGLPNFPAPHYRFCARWQDLCPCASAKEQKPCQRWTDRPQILLYPGRARFDDKA